MSKKEATGDRPEPCTCDMCTKGILPLLDGKRLAILVRDGDRQLRRR